MQATALLEIKLAPDWKTYWRSPGSGGLPLEIQWDDPSITHQIFWPVPEHFFMADLHAQGYQGNIALPIELHGKLPQQLSGTLSVATCNNICYLSQYPFILDFNTDSNPTFATKYRQALDKTPLEKTLIQSTIPSYQPGKLTLQLTKQGNWVAPQLFLDDIKDVMSDAPSITISGNQLTAEIAIQSDNDSNMPDLANQHISFVVADQHQAQDIKTIVATTKKPLKSESFSLLSIIGIAFLGGLILNLMPCVLPVIAMKLGSVLYTNVNNRALLRKQFFASSLGILVSFWLLALMMTLLRLADISLGWGIQFQNPYFLGFMVMVTALFSANLLGILHVYLPSSLNNYLAQKGNQSLTGHFLQGMLATLLATPCSAPFLGTALAVALVAPLAQLWLIFTFLGLGMSLPWLSVAIFPTLAQFIPKPGRWMIVIRIILGLMMLASCIWLMTLLANYTGWVVANIIIGIFIVWISFAFIKYYSLKTTCYTFLSVGLLIGTAFIAKYIVEQKTIPYTYQDKVAWQALSEEAIKKALAEKKRVFIDITADWCMTCKINKVNILMHDDIQQLLSQDDIVALRGDWTKPTDQITQFLKDRGKFAVPFNQIYGPNLPDGQILSTILTYEEIISLMNKAKG